MSENSEIFNYPDYRNYLHVALKLRSSSVKGVRSRLAETLGCQPGYLSRILAGTADLSLEQADQANRFLQHSEEECRYFLLLVEKGRAGTPRLKAFFERELQAMRKARLDLKERFKTGSTMNSEQQSRYFSHWYFAGIHAAISVPQNANRSALSRALGLPLEKVNEVVDFLVGTGLITEEGGHLRVGTTRLHLGSDSALVSRHHANWRLQAMQAQERDRGESLHYSSVVTLSREDFLKVKAELVKAIEISKKTIRNSQDEQVCCLNVDWFQLRDDL